MLILKKIINSYSWFQVLWDFFGGRIGFVRNANLNINMFLWLLRYKKNYNWCFRWKICLFLSLFLLTMFSRHCKLDLLHSLMLPPKGPALHIHLNKLKYSSTWKHQTKNTFFIYIVLLWSIIHMAPSSIWAIWNDLQYVI